MCHNAKTVYETNGLRNWHIVDNWIASILTNNKNIKVRLSSHPTFENVKVVEILSNADNIECIDIDPLVLKLRSSK